MNIEHGPTFPAPTKKPELPSIAQERELFQNILDTIQFTDPDHKDRPALQASEFAIAQLARLDHDLQLEGSEKSPKAVAVVRCWNKKQEDLRVFVERFHRFKASIPNLAGVIMSINKEGEREVGVTETNLRTILSQTDSGFQVPIVPLSVERYTWTSGLNGPLALVNEIALRRELNREEIRIMNVSFDVELDEENLVKTNTLMQTQDLVFTVRQTGDQKTPAKEMEDQQKIWTRFKEIMRDPLRSDLAELSYVFRNTYNIFRLSDLVRLGGFNPLCNGDVRKFASAHPSPTFFYEYKPTDVNVSIQGMEDTEFFMRMLLNAKALSKIGPFRNMHKALAQPVAYRDLSWEHAPELNKIKKIANEMTALSKILSGLAASEYHGSGAKKAPSRITKDYRLPTAMQDFRLR